MTGPRIRLWSSDWLLIWDSATSAQPIEDFLRDYEWCFVTRDQHRQRWSGRISRTVYGGLNWEDDYQHLRHILVWSNPYLGHEIDEILAPLYSDVYLSYCRWLYASPR